jgi:hypothetical protein
MELQEIFVIQSSGPIVMAYSVGLAISFFLASLKHKVNT